MYPAGPAGNQQLMMCSRQQLALGWALRGPHSCLLYCWMFLLACWPCGTNFFMIFTLRFQLLLPRGSAG